MDEVGSATSGMLPFGRVLGRCLGGDAAAGGLGARRAGGLDAGAAALASGFAAAGGTGGRTGDGVSKAARSSRFVGAEHASEGPTGAAAFGGRLVIGDG